MGKTTGREHVGETTSEMLIIGTRHSADICHVTITAGQGTLKRGTVLASDESGKCAILGTEGYKAAYILAEDSDDTTEADVVAAAYRSGDFNKGALIVKEDYKMTEADIAALRNGGIYLGNVM